jgi:hypothetical protein
MDRGSFPLGRLHYDGARYVLASPSFQSAARSVLSLNHRAAAGLNILMTTEDRGGATRTVEILRQAIPLP